MTKDLPGKGVKSEETEMASKPMIGKLSEYDPDIESFENFSERLDNFFTVNSIKDTDKKAYFISLMGPKMYATLKNLLVPDVPKDKAYSELIDVLKAHYAPKKNITYERFLFNKRNQRENEAIAEYAVQLRKLASSCQFETFLEQALRDRFLCGLRSSHIQSKLLAEGEKLTFDKAIEAALLVENAESNTRSLHTESLRPASEVNFVKNKFGKSVPKYMNRPKQNFKNQKLKSCYRCGKDHEARNCPYKGYTCNLCRQKGHLAAVCFQNKNRPGKNKSNGKMNFCDGEEDGWTGEEDGEEKLSSSLNEVYLNTIAYSEEGPKATTKQFMASVFVNDVPLSMTVDTGAVVSCIPDRLYFQKFQHSLPKLKESELNLKTYTGEDIKVLGEFEARVRTSEGETKLLPLVVVKSMTPNQPILLGRNWLTQIKLDWTKIGQRDSSLNHVDGKTAPISEISVSKIKEKYSEVFDTSSSYGQIKNMEVDLVLKENVRPVFCKPHNVPFALRPAVEAELKALEENGIICPVTRSEWATPVVVVPKDNGSVRLCGNYKITINPCIRTDHYPLPVPDEIFNKISGAKLFCKLDLANAYAQCKVSEASQELLTINTHKGLYKYLRLPYGVSSAGPLFQAVMDKILGGLKNTFCYLDDVLLIGDNEKETIALLETVLERFQSHGLKVNSAKSEFLKPSVKFLGHVLDGSGIHPAKELTEAILKAPKPENTTQLRSYLGLVNYYGKFLPNLSSLLYPLYQLLNNGVDWVWNVKCEKAFEESKNLLVRNNVLMPFNPDLEITVTCDSSNYGVGAVLSHSLPNGTERPVAFASRTLNKCEVKYAQVEKEALALIFAVKKFHIFLYGRKFKLVTDHRALTFLLGPTKAIPTLSAARIQRWALILATYQYDLVYRKGSDISNADALSRLPCKVESEEEEGINFFSANFNLPITYKEIGLATRFDPVLSKVMDLTLNGWPLHVEDDRLKPYTDKTLQLSVERDCVLWGSRIVIPPPFRQEILILLHTEHPGESRMKALARSFVWWPKIDKDIEVFVSECEICQKTRKSVPLAPLQQWSWPHHNWQRLHLDFATLDGKDFLILVDSRSKWVEIYHMASTTSLKVIEKLRTCFAAYGLPNTVVTDGGPQFTSQEFKDFLKSNGVLHVLSPPYHPASNGLAERMVQTMKEGFRKQLLEDSNRQTSRTLQHRIDNFLFAYRNTPHSLTGLTPAEMFLKVKPRTPLSFLKPHLTTEMESKKEKIKIRSDSHRGKPRAFLVDEKVFVRTVRNEKVNWQPGIVTTIVSPVTYKVKVDGRTRFVHVDHLRTNNTKGDDEEELVRPILKEAEQKAEPVVQETPRVQQSPTTSPQKSTKSTNQEKSPQPSNSSSEDQGQDTEENKNIRRSQRARKPPDKLNL